MKLFARHFMNWSVCLLIVAGLTAPRYSDILCVGNTGYVEFETFCLPVCDEVIDLCALESEAENHDDASGSSQCSDFEIDSTLWSSRLSKFISNVVIHSFNIPLHTVSYNTFSIINNYYPEISSQDSYKIHNTDLIASVILRC